MTSAAKPVSRITAIDADGNERWHVQQRSKRGHLCCLFCGKVIPRRVREYDAPDNRSYFCSTQHGFWYATNVADQLVRRAEDLELKT